jgi:hypothetical protein
LSPLSRRGRAREGEISFFSTKPSEHPLALRERGRGEGFATKCCHIPVEHLANKLFGWRQQEIVCRLPHPNPLPPSP